LFREPLGYLIKRTKKISKDGFEANSDSEPRSQNEEKPDQVQNLLDSIGNSIVISDREVRINTELIQNGLNADGDTAKVLIQHLAGTQTLLELEQVYASIFGGQIFLLKKLNEVAGQGLLKSNVLKIVSIEIENFKEQVGEWTDEQYLGFLIKRHLIVENSEQVHITNNSVEFLTWMARNGRRENRTR